MHNHGHVQGSTLNGQIQAAAALMHSEAVSPSTQHQPLGLRNVHPQVWQAHPLHPQGQRLWGLGFTRLGRGLPSLGFTRLGRGLPSLGFTRLGRGLPSLGRATVFYAAYLTFLKLDHFPDWARLGRVQGHGVRGLRGLARRRLRALRLRLRYTGLMAPSLL
jgi:hypothetical protein